MSDDYIGIMTKEVVSEMRNTNAPFRTVFMNVAHRRNIIHGKNANQYNYFFAQVLKRVKRLPGFDSMKQTLPPTKIAPCETTTSEDVPQKVLDFKQRAAHDVR